MTFCLFESTAPRALATTFAAAAALAASAALAHPGLARAGQFHVYSCRTPDGQSAPADGWSGSVATGGAWDDYALNSCAGGGALVAALGDQTTHAANADLASWAFRPSPDYRVVGASLWRSGVLPGGMGTNSSYQVWLAAPALESPVDECVFVQGCAGKGNPGEPMSQSNEVTIPKADLGGAIYASAACSGGAGRECPAGTGDANGYAAAMYLFAADVTLEQAEGPRASAVGGELASAPVVRGESDVAFDATDAGAGVYEAVFSVDGQTVQRTTLDSNGGRCRDVGQTTDGTAAFEYVQPCLGSVSADVAFDSTSVSNGTHHLLVSVIDAAGNAAPVLDREVTVDNPPPPGAPGPPNGANASAQASLSVRWKATRRTRLLSAFGRAQTLDGRLTGPGGVPIAGAQIDLRATPSYTGAKPISMASLRTDASGRFSARIAGGESSRTLRFSYRAHLGDALPVVTRTLRLSVRAGGALRVAPHSASVGTTIAFRGRLRGGSVPPSGKQLVLEARSPGSQWIEFKVVRTDARGRYRASYRFKFAGPADYVFRVRSEPESDYPFAAGTSNVVAVHER
jgi:hypothetical protein